VAREDFSRVGTELGRISWWWPGAWPFATRERTLLNDLLTIEEKGVYPSYTPKHGMKPGERTRGTSSLEPKNKP